MRLSAAQRPAPPPAVADTDEIDRTARQVRLDYPEAVIHGLTASWSDPWGGNAYMTGCAEALSNVEGAILTTRDVTCWFCLAGERRPNR